MLKTIKSFAITQPLPPRGSATALREQLVEHLRRIRPLVGERFHSDHELARIASLSRPTVRRALDDLERDGWIERRPGIGTFIGPRAAMDGARKTIIGTKRAVRLALMIHLLGDFAHDWYAAGVINGVDSAAEECEVSLELLGARDGDVKAVSRRLQQSRPDVLAMAGPSLRHAALIGEAARLDIPCIGTGTLLSSMGLPTICEDGEDGARRAVKHLVENGHTRIGFVASSYPLPWVFQRRRGFMRGLLEAGLPDDEGLICWLNADDNASATPTLARFIEAKNPTALLFASWTGVRFISPLIRDGLSVPRDLSVVSFDQSPAVMPWLGGVEPTTMTLPLLAMGQRMAQMASDLICQERVLEPVTMFPCELIQGDSVRSLNC